MKIETASAEVGLVAQANGSYQLALYQPADNTIIKIDVDPVLAWMISCTMHAPITSAALSSEQL